MGHSDGLMRGERSLPSLSTQRAEQDIRKGRMVKTMGQADGKTKSHSKSVQQGADQTKLEVMEVDRGEWYSLRSK